MEHEAFVTTVMAVVALLFVAAISAVVTRRIHFPYTVGLVVIGVAVAFIADDYPVLAHALDELKLGPVMIMFLFIPILIFESAFNMDVPLLMRNLAPALTLAGPGLLISTALIGGLIHLLTPMPLESALIFGCLISATDPVAVIALFREVDAPARLNTLVEGESVLNDATAIVTFQIILAVIATGILDGETITNGVIDFFVVFFGGLLVGLVFGWLMVKAIPLVGDQPLVHITLTLVTAYGAFIVADHFLDASGIMAVLSAGLTIGYYGPTQYKQKVSDYLKMFWEDAAFVANSLIFLMLGLSEKIFLAHTGSNPEGLLYPVLIAIAVVMLVRFAVIYGLVPVLNMLPGARFIEHSYRFVLAWGGLRGAVAIALAMSLPNHFPYRWQIIDFAFGVTLFMLLVNGTSMSWLIRRLGLNKPSLVEKYMEVHAVAEAERNAISRLRGHRPVVRISDEQRQAIIAPHVQRLEQTQSRLRALRIQLADNRYMRRKLLWLRSFAVQREMYQKRVANGLLSRRAHQALVWDLKHMHIDMDERHPVPVQHLPSDRWSTAALLHRLQRMTPDVRLFHGIQNRYCLALTEEATAVIAAARAVRKEMEELAGFSAAEPEDVENCRHYYQRLENMACERLERLAESSADSGEAMLLRMASRLAVDARLDAIQELAQSGKLPEHTATRLNQRFEDEQALQEEGAP
jgi:CPA1 family monovalent cation:H+ antiporter